MQDKEPSAGRRRHKKPSLRIVLYASAALLLIVALSLALLQSPFFVNRLAGLLVPGGYSVRVKGISVSPALKGEVSGLQVSRPGDGLLLNSPSVEFKGRITPSLQGEVEEAVLTGPKFFIRLGGARGGGFDLSFLEKIPPVRLLRIEKGEVRVSFASPAMGIEGVDITGLELTLRGFSAEGGGKLYLKGSLALHPSEKAGAGGTGRFEGSVDLAGFLPSPAGQGSLKVFMDSASYGEASLKATTVELSFGLGDGAVKVRRASLGASHLRYVLQGKAVSFDKPSALLSMDYDTQTRGFSATLLEAQLPPLGSFKGSISGSLKPPAQWKSSLEATSLDIQRAFAFSKPYLPPKYRGWSLGGKGEGRLDLEGTYSDKALSWAGDLVFKISDGEFSSPEGDEAGAGLSGKIVLKLKSLPQGHAGDGPGDEPADSRHRKIGFEASSSVEAGEVLFGRYYRAFSRGDLSLRARGSFFLTSAGPAEFEAWPDLFQTARYHLWGTLAKGRWDIGMKAESISLPRVFHEIKAGYLGKGSSLAGLVVNGTSGLEARITKDRGYMGATGRLKTTGASASLPGAFSVEGVELTVPFDLSYPAPGNDSIKEDDASTGAVKVASLSVDGLKVRDVGFPVSASRNSFRVPANITMGVLGGGLVIKGFGAAGLLSDSMTMDFGLGLTGADLGELDREFFGRRLSGRVEAEMPSVSYRKGMWKADGEVTARVFGGTVRATGIFVEAPFSSSRGYGADVTFEGIRLGKVTDRIPIGKMDGVISGSLTGFQVEYGQPSAFVLKLHSVKTKGVKQSISVEAIKNLSILGTGSSAIGRVLNSGLNRFFEYYPYSRIGILVTLRNDRMSVRGTIHEGGTEYLIRKGFFRGIDMINQNPDNVVSFRDMRERIKRIFTSAREKKIIVK